MNLIQALRLPNNESIMTNIARFHYENLYNNPKEFITFGGDALKTTRKGYTCDYSELYLRYSSVIFESSQIAVIESDGIDAISSGFSGCYMASFTHRNNRYVAHIPMTGNNTKVDWNNAVSNNVISNVVLFKPTEGMTASRLIGIWGIVTYNNRCYRLEVNEDAPPSMGRRVFNSIPGPPILTELTPITNGIIP